MQDTSHVLKHQDLQISLGISYEERPVKILDRKEKVLRNKVIRLVKVWWQNRAAEDATWEIEKNMSQKYITLFRFSRTKLIQGGRDL